MKKKLLLGVSGFLAALVLAACGNEVPDTGAPTGSGNVDINNEVPTIDGGTVTVNGVELPAPRFTPDPAIPSWQQDQEHFAELTWYVNYIWWPAHEMGDSWVTEVMKGDLNVHITFISGNTDNLNTMIAAGDLPDIITLGGYNTSIVNEAHEFALPIDVLAALYDPYFLDNVLHPQRRAWFTHEDGHMYAIPNESLTSDEINAGFAFPGAGFLVRQDIYEALGGVDMTTPEGFLDALRVARDFMPTNDHGLPLIPFSGASMNVSTGDNGSFSGNLQDFLAIPVIDENGNWYDRDADPEYLEWMLVFRQALEEGLMSMDQFSDDNESINDNFATGRYFAFMTHNTADIASRLAVIANSDSPEQMMIPVIGPRNSAGDPHTFSAGAINGWTHTFITRQAADPQTAMQVITYLSSDHGQMIQQFGQEGVTFEYVDGVPTLLPEIQDFLATDYYGFRDEWGIRTFWMLRRPGLFASLGVLPTGPHGDVQIFNSQFNQARLEFLNLEPTEGQLQRDLESIDLARSQAIVNMLTASDDETAIQIWENFLNSRQSFDEITEYRNNRLNENRERLGMQ